MTIAIQFTTKVLKTRAKELSHFIQIPLASPSEFYDYLLLLSPAHLALKKTNDSSKPLFIDFFSFFKHRV